MAKITMREAISQALWEEMERDPKVFIMGEEVGVWGGSYAVTEAFMIILAPIGSGTLQSLKLLLSVQRLAQLSQDYARSLN